MAKNVTRDRDQVHPTWCNAKYRQSRRKVSRPPLETHDPHESYHELVEPDHPSQTTVEAYLLELAGLKALAVEQLNDTAIFKAGRLMGWKHNVAPEPPLYQAPLLALKITEPGEQDGYHLLTFAQMCDLNDALNRLVAIGRGGQDR